MKYAGRSIELFLTHLFFQANDDNSNSSTQSEGSPTPELEQRDNENKSSLWHALRQNGYTPPGNLSGEASHLLKKLISCRKLGMSITPTPPHVLNYTLFQDQQKPPTATSPNLSIEKSSGRRKQSFPTKANVSVEGSTTTQEKPEQVEEESPMDFTGNSPWCSYLKSKVSKHSNQN